MLLKCVSYFTIFPLILLQIKTESGSKVKAKKTGIYNKWKQRSHSKISLRGTSNEEAAEESTSFAGELLSSLQYGK